MPCITCTSHVHNEKLQNLNCGACQAQVQYAKRDNNPVYHIYLTQTHPTQCLQALQSVDGISPHDIKGYVDACYTDVSSSLLRSRSDVDESLARLVTGGRLKVCSHDTHQLPFWLT